MPAPGVISTGHDPLDTDLPTARESRAGLLSPFMERVRAFVDEADAEIEDLVYEGSLGAVRLSFSEADAIRNALAGTGGATGSSHGLLLAEALAMCLKIAEDVHDYQIATRVDDQLTGTIGSVLELDLQASKSLVQDFSDPIDNAFAAELREQAVRLGEIRLAVRQHMAHVRRTLAGQQHIEDTPQIPGARGSIEVLPEAASDPDTEPPDQLEESRRRYQQLKIKRRRERLEKVKMRRIWWLLIGLGLTIAVGAAGFAYHLQPVFDTKVTIILTIDDFEGVPGIFSVLAKPPSVFVTVDSGYWNSLNRQSKSKIVVQVGHRLLKTDYNGAVITGTDGQVVGEWVRGVGSYVYPME
jgi:hypothetical protein